MGKKKIRAPLPVLPAGISVIDTYKLCEHHKIINFRVAKEGEHKMPVEKFAGHLAYQLITNTTMLLSMIDPEIREVQQLQVSPSIPGELSNATVNCITVESSLTGKQLYWYTCYKL